MGTRDERMARQRAEMEEAAITLFEERGFDAVSMEEIATAAGLSRATAFRYYGSKEAVLFANHDRELRSLMALLEACPAARRSWAEFRLVIHRFAVVLEEEGEALRRRAQIVAGHERLMAIADGTSERWRRAISIGLAGEAEVSDNDEVIAALGVDALRLGTRRWYRSGASTPLSYFVDAVFDEIDATFSPG